MTDPKASSGARAAELDADLAPSIEEMTVPELEAELALVWNADWQHARTMTLDELRAEVARVWVHGRPGVARSQVFTGLPGL